MTERTHGICDMCRRSYLLAELREFGGFLSLCDECVKPPRPRDVGVHVAHCCVDHGCKYGDVNCPVVGRQAQADGTCSWCADVRNAKDKAMQIIRNSHLDHYEGEEIVDQLIAHDMIHVKWSW